LTLRVTQQSHGVGTWLSGRCWLLKPNILHLFFITIVVSSLRASIIVPCTHLFTCCVEGDLTTPLISIMATTIHLFDIEPSSSESSSNIDIQHDGPSGCEMTAMPTMQHESLREVPNRPKSAITRPSTYHEVDRVVVSADNADDADVVPKTPAELELSRPSTPRHGSANVAQALQRWDNPSMNKWRTLAACLFCLANGCNDSAVSG